MWIAWVAWVVNGTMFDFFFILFVVLLLVFNVLLKVSCVWHVPSFKRQKYVARSIFDRKKVQQASLGCARAFVTILNIEMCVFCEWRWFFFEFPADQTCGHVYTTAVKRVSKNMDMMWHWNSRNVYIHILIFRSTHCECDAGSLSKQCIEPIHGSRCFAFVVVALLLLHLVYWFLNHVAIPCERKSLGW